MQTHVADKRFSEKKKSVTLAENPKKVGVKDPAKNKMDQLAVSSKEHPNKKMQNSEGRMTQGHSVSSPASSETPREINLPTAEKTHFGKEIYAADRDPESLTNFGSRDSSAFENSRRVSEDEFGILGSGSNYPERDLTQAADDEISRENIGNKALQAKRRAEKGPSRH